MAVAALEILGLTDRIAETLGVDVAVPMVGQGCVAAECRADDVVTARALAAVDHVATRRAVECERAFLAELGAGCSMPVAAHLGATGTLRAFMAREDGSNLVQIERAVAPDDDHVAAGVAAAVHCRAAVTTAGA